MTGDPELMRTAFRKGQVRLTLDDGVALDVALVGHTEGSPTAYFHIEPSRRLLNQLVMS